MDHSESVWGKSFCWLLLITCMCAQSCLTLCNPMDCGPPGSSIHGILQARILEWGAISSSRGSSWPRNRTVSPALAGGFFATEPISPCLYNLTREPRMTSVSLGGWRSVSGSVIAWPTLWLQCVRYCSVFCSVLASPAALGLVQEVKSGSHPSKTGVGSENQHRRWCGYLA